MMKPTMRAGWRTGGLLVMLPAWTTTGCDKQSSSQVQVPAEAKPAAPGSVEPAAKPTTPAPASTDQAPQTASQPAASAAEIKAQVEARLAAADALDGTVDQVVTRCANCRLAMDGSREHTAEFEGYTLLFCTSFCRDRFLKDPQALILALPLEKK